MIMEDSEMIGWKILFMYCSTHFHQHGTQEKFVAEMQVVENMNIFLVFQDSWQKKANCLLTDTSGFFHVDFGFCFLSSP